MTLIVNSAFGFDSLTGGMLGAAIAWGVKRGIYSNEAGQVRGRMLRRRPLFLIRPSRALCSFSVYIDTLFVCSATGFMILMTGCYNMQAPDGSMIFEGLKGVEAGPVYTQAAIDQLIARLGWPLHRYHDFLFCLHDDSRLLLYGRDEYGLS